MSIQFLLLPLFVQVILTLLVLYTLAGRRFFAVRGDELRGPVALREPNWPERTRQAEYNYQNQFELPVLFYVLDHPVDLHAPCRSTVRSALLGIRGVAGSACRRASDQ